MLSAAVLYCYAESQCGECRYADSRGTTLKQCEAASLEKSQKNEKGIICQHQARKFRFFIQKLPHCLFPKKLKRTSLFPSCACTIKYYRFSFYGLRGQLVFMSKPVKVTNNNKGTS